MQISNLIMELGEKVIILRKILRWRDLWKDGREFYEIVSWLFFVSSYKRKGGKYAGHCR